MNEQSIDIVIRAKDEASRALWKIKGSIGGLKGTLEKIWKASVVAFGALAIAVNDGKNAIEADAQATFRLTKLLKVTVNATDAQTKALIAQADALEKTTVAGKDMVLTTQSQLATFNLQTSTIEKLTPSIVDYVIAEKWATASADDFRSMTNWLAQALNGNFASLTKSGFVLDQHTKNLIKNGTESEKAAALAKVLGSTYGGFATEATQTAIGKQIMLNKALEDINKTIASAVIPIIDDLKLRLYEIVKVILDWTEKNPELTKQIIIAVAAIVTIWSTLLVVIPIISAMSTAISWGILVVKGLWVALTFLATNPIGLVITALALLAGALYLVWKNWDTIKANLVLMWNQLKIDISSIVDWLRDYIFGIFTAIGSYVTEKIDFLKNKAAEAANFLRSILASYEQSKVWQAMGNAGAAVYDATHGERATGGTMMSNQPYLVGERGREIVIPKSASTVIPASEVKWGGPSISINFGGVSVRNDSDIRAIASAVEESITRKMQLYRQGITA